jgi:hypothetical protein
LKLLNGLPHGKDRQQDACQQKLVTPDHFQIQAPSAEC